MLIRSLLSGVLTPETLLFRLYYVAGNSMLFWVGKHHSSSSLPLFIIFANSLVLALSMEGLINGSDIPELS